MTSKNLTNKQTPLPEFPRSAYCGSLYDLAQLETDNTEIPLELAYGAALTHLGACASGRVRLSNKAGEETRLYSVLLGASGDSKKSSAARAISRFFETLKGTGYGQVNGISSAEGLARVISEHQADQRNTLVYLDELKMLEDKAGIQGSGLLSCITQLFEQGNYESPVKDKNQSANVNEGRLSLLACATDQTYAAMWSDASVAIGLHNRLCVFGGNPKPRVAWPEPPDEYALNQVRSRLQRQLDSLPPYGTPKPLVLGITAAARKQWGDYYHSLPTIGDGENTKRLSTIGFRLMPILTLTCDKKEIDSEIVGRVCSILTYQRKMRALIDPIQVETMYAKVEELIRRHLRDKGPMGKWELGTSISYTRYGTHVFSNVLNSLTLNGEVTQHPVTRKYSLVQRS